VDVFVAHRVAGLKAHDAAALGTRAAQHAGQTPGVDAGNGHRAFVIQILRQRACVRQRACGAEAGHAQRHVLDDQASGMHAGRFDILVIDTDVADVRIRQRDDLPAVAGVGEDFLVAGERGVEHHLAHRVAGCTDAGAEEGRAVCECEQCGGQDGQQVESSEVRAPIAIRSGMGPRGNRRRSFVSAAGVS